MQLSPVQIEFIRLWAETKPLIAGVVLFGSRAKDAATVESDIDLGLIFSPEDQDSALVYSNWINSKRVWTAELETITGSRVDLFEWTEGQGVYASDKEHAVTIFER